MRGGISRWWAASCVLVAAGITGFGLYSAALEGVVGPVVIFIPMVRVVCPLFKDCMDRIGPLLLGVALNVAFWSVILFYVTAWLHPKARRAQPKAGA